MDKDRVLRRIDQLLRMNYEPGDDRAASIWEALQGTFTLASSVYGHESPQVKALLAADEQVRAVQGPPGPRLLEIVLPRVKGTLQCMKVDVQEGLIGSTEMRGAGAALSDFLDLAKGALAQGTEKSKNVAAVLVAASYEDTIRRMGATLAGVTGRPSLSKVIDELKARQVLGGAPLVTATGYVKFRNDALHADWGSIDRAIVGSCLAFVEGLLLKHFS